MPVSRKEGRARSMFLCKAKKQQGDGMQDKHAVSILHAEQRIDGYSMIHRHVAQADIIIKPRLTSTGKAGFGPRVQPKGSSQGFIPRVQPKGSAQGFSPTSLPGKN